jgi:hypothetical protein
MRVPLVTVITPSLNHAAYIRQTIESVLTQQDYPHVEHIVIDGGSTDGTIEILREYGDRFGDKFRWVSEPDSGQSNAFNKGLRMAKGDIIGWQNSDDYYYPNVFGQFVGAFAEHPEVVAVYGGCDYRDESGNVVETFHAVRVGYRHLLEYSGIENQACFIRREPLLRCGGLAEDFHFAMDLDLWFRLRLLGCLEPISGVHAVFRLLPTAKTQRANRVAADLELVASIEGILGRQSLAPAVRPALWAALHSRRAKCMFDSLAVGDSPTAEVQFRRLVEDDTGLRASDTVTQCVIYDSRRDWPSALEIRSLHVALSHLDGWGARRYPLGKQLAALYFLVRSMDCRKRRDWLGAVTSALRVAQYAPTWLPTRGGPQLLVTLLFGARVGDSIVAHLKRIAAWRQFAEDRGATHPHC